MRTGNGIDRWLMDHLGTEWCGNGAPPLTNRSVYIKDDATTRVFATVDDGGFVGIGYPDEWQVILRTKAARMMAWWILRTWVADWFGLRSSLYYRALHHRCGGRWTLRYPYPKSKRLTRRSSHDEWFADRPAA